MGWINMGKWKTIKNHPNSMRLVLCYDARRRPEDVYFLGKYYEMDWYDEYGNTCLYPQYWTDVPKPPSKGRGPKIGSVPRGKRSKAAS